MQAIHQHLLVKATVYLAPKVAEELNDWLRNLVSAIGMKVCIEPRSIYVNADGNQGLTGQVGIETSHIAIHIWDEQIPSVVQMDVYSCHSFEEAVVKEALNQWNIATYDSMMIDRAEAPFVIFR